MIENIDIIDSLIYVAYPVFDENYQSNKIFLLMSLAIYDKHPLSFL